MANQSTAAVMEQAEVKSPAEIANGCCSEPHALPVEKPTAFNSIAELQKEAPELYQKLLEGLALEICREMREHQARMKKIMRENSHH